MSLKTASKILNKERVDALVSIGTEGDRLPFGFNKVPSRIRLEFDDIEAKELGGWAAPTENDVQRIIDFAHRIKSRDSSGSVHKNILVHCFAGISRSTAAAFIMKCVWSGPGKEQTETNIREVIDSTLDEVPDPNRLMVEIADQLLGREGEMVRVRAEYFDIRNSMY